MRTALVVGAVVSVAGCKFLSPDLVAIDPEYGYVDGCTSTTLQGHHLGTDATGTVDGQPFFSIAPAEENPARPEHAQDIGFLYNAVTPAQSSGESGYVDVTLSVDGEELKLHKGFYYLACPQPLNIENYRESTPRAVGETVLLVGCGIPAATTGRLLQEDGTEVATFGLSEVCSTAQASFDVPSVAAATYVIELTHPDGTVFGGACPPADTGDTGEACVPITFTVQ